MLISIQPVIDTVVLKLLKSPYFYIKAYFTVQSENFYNMVPHNVHCTQHRIE